MKAKKRREEKNGTRGSARQSSVQMSSEGSGEKHGCVNPAAEETSRLMSPSRL